MLALCLLVAGCSDGGPVTPRLTATPSFDIHGDVQNAATAEHLSGVTVEIITGAFAGHTARTDDLGQFRFFAVSDRDVQLRVSVPAFETMTRGVVMFSNHANASFILRPLPAPLSGRVTETAPTEAVPVADARVTLWNRFQVGLQQVTTDRDGRFSASIVCPCGVRVEAEGYDGPGLVSHPDNRPLDIQLSPKARLVVETIGSVSGPPRPPTSVFRDIRFPGRIIVSDFSFPASSIPRAPAVRTVEIWEGTRLLAAGSAFAALYAHRFRLEVEVRGDARYEIRITGGEWFRVTITRPI